jgi:hypothetical protein
METQKELTGNFPKGDGDFRIEGRVQLEAVDTLPSDMKLLAYAFDSGGQLLGTGDVDPKGSFSVLVKLTRPADVELVIGPADDPQAVRKSSAYSHTFSAKEWIGEGNKFRLKADIFLPRYVWWPWRPIRVCISGHVRKIYTTDGHTQVCPVPYVKVEIFDVDREGCFWPYIRRWWDLLLDRSVIRIPDLLTEPPFPPKPFPGPGPLEQVQSFRGRPLSRAEMVSFNPQPEPPSPGEMVSINPQPEPPYPGEMVGFNPQPEPPELSSLMMTQQPAQIGMLRVGEMSTLASDVAARLENLTLTSKIAPWLIFPRCFYSKQLVCETHTDCDGYFRCCFRWWPFHFRKGRLRFDARPDVIIRVTQVINGVETVIYMDPYTSTRWNVTNAHIDLFLDNEEVQCGKGCGPAQPAGPAVFFTLIGLDEVYKINQTTGKFSNTAYGGSLKNVAYGGWLYIYGLFGEALSTGAPKRYYRLSFKKGAADFKSITTSLSDTRVNKLTFDSEIHSLGPQTINGVPNLYEVRNTADYYWYNREWIGLWNTEAEEADEGLYTLRLEVFNELGVKLTSAVVDYRNGAVPPPGPLPPMVDCCDLVILIDNKYPTVDLQIPAAGGECGVVPFSAAPTLTINANVNQENGRLYYWRLFYVKGLTGVPVTLASNSNGGGLAVPVSQSVSGAPMTAGLTGTCAFSLTLDAWPLVRNGFWFIHYNYVTKAIAIEKCPELPKIIGTSIT